MIYGGKLFQSLIVLGRKLYVSIINLLGPFALAINDPHDIFTSRLDSLAPMEDQRELLGRLPTSCRCFPEHFRKHLRLNTNSSEYFRRRK